MWFVKVHWLLIWLSDIQVNQNQRADISLGICYGDGPNYIKKQHLPLSVLVALKESTDDSLVVLLQHHCQSNMSLWYRCYVLEPQHVSLQLTNILVQVFVQMLMNHCGHVEGYRGLTTPYIMGRSGFVILSQLKNLPQPEALWFNTSKWDSGNILFSWRLATNSSLPTPFGGEERREQHELGWPSPPSLHQTKQKVL